MQMENMFNLDEFEALPSAALQRLAERAEWELQGIRHQQQGLYDVEAVDRQIERLLGQCNGRQDRVEALADRARNALINRQVASFDTSRIREFFVQGSQRQPAFAGTAAYGRGEGGAPPDYGRMEVGEVMGEPVAVAARRSPVGMDGVGEDILEGTPRQETGAGVEAEPSPSAATSAAEDQRERGDLAAARAMTEMYGAEEPQEAADEYQVAAAVGQDALNEVAEEIAEGPDAGTPIDMADARKEADRISDAITVRPAGARGRTAGRSDGQERRRNGRAPRKGR